MSFKMRLIFHELLGGVGFGLFLAIQGVFFLQKGLDLWQIGVVFGVIVAATALFELPFGAMADIYGRIRVFQASRLVYLAAILALLFSAQFWGVIIASALLGLAQALNSGSIEAWVVERLNAEGEGDKLQSYIGTFQAAMAGGLTIGAIVGGYIPKLLPETTLFSPTGWNLVIAFGVVTLHLLLTPFLFHEGEEVTAPEDRETLAHQLQSAVGFAFDNPTLRGILVLGVFLGLAIVSIEAYWQPRLVEIAGEPTYVAFGWITAGYFAMAILGPMLIGLLAEGANISARAQVAVLPLILAGGLFVLSMQGSFAPYVGAYLAFMLVFSMINPPVATLLNEESPDSSRSTMQSLLSFVLTVGGAVAMLIFAFLVKQIGIAQTWALAAAVLALVSIVLMLTSWRKNG